MGERISLRGICRAVGVSLTGLLHVMVESFAACPEHVHARLPGEPTGVVIQRLEAEADELWSFIPWVWMAMDAKIRSRESGVQLWGKVPEVYHQQAVFHTDLSDVYEGIIPVQRRNAITKKAGRTDYIERLNNTLRPRVARLVRETLSFSKKLGNHLSAIKFFICRYHLAKAAALPV